MVELRERKGTPLLGGTLDKNRAEKLIEWSKKKSSGASYNLKFSNGVSLDFVARGEEPRIYIRFNPRIFKELLSALGPLDRLVLSFFGLGMNWYKEHLTISLLTAKNPVTLWDSEHDFVKKQGDANTSFLLGMVKLNDNPEFYSEIENQKELELVSALAVYDSTAAGISKKLPEKRELSTGTKVFLARDAILNAVLTGLNKR